MREPECVLMAGSRQASMSRKVIYPAFHLRLLNILVMTKHPGWQAGVLCTYKVNHGILCLLAVLQLYMQGEVKSDAIPYHVLSRPAVHTACHSISDVSVASREPCTRKPCNLSLRSCL